MGTNHISGTTEARVVKICRIWSPSIRMTNHSCVNSYSHSVDVWIYHVSTALLLRRHFLLTEQAKRLSFFLTNTAPTSIGWILRRRYSPHTFTDHAEIWRAKMNMWCTLLRRIWPWSVHRFTSAERKTGTLTAFTSFTFCGGCTYSGAEKSWLRVHNNYTNLPLSNVIKTWTVKFVLTT